MKKPYEKPQMEIQYFEVEEDIAGITTSGMTGVNDPFLEF